MINFDYLKGVANGDESFMKEMMSLFQTEIPKQLHLINSHFSSHDFAGLREKVHRYKATLLTLGMTDAVEAVKRIETECTSSKDADKIKSDIEKVMTESEQALSQINERLRA